MLLSSMNVSRRNYILQLKLFFAEVEWAKRILDFEWGIFTALHRTASCDPDEPLQHVFRVHILSLNKRSRGFISFVYFIFLIRRCNYTSHYDFLFLNYSGINHISCSVESAHFSLSRQYNLTHTDHKEVNSFGILPSAEKWKFLRNCYR